EIVRGLDGAAHRAGIAVFAVHHSSGPSIGSVLDAVQQFRPRAVASAALSPPPFSLSSLFSFSFFFLLPFLSSSFLFP
ncbi:hypothetical protein ACCS62_37415, partial [Rhizobium ruizarguesonis]